MIGVEGRINTFRLLYSSQASLDEADSLCFRLFVLEMPLIMEALI